MRAPDRLSIRARLRVSILALVTTIVIALSGLHLHGVIDETFRDIGQRAMMLTEQVNSSLLDAVNRRAGSPEGRSFAENQAIWYETVRTDPSIRRLLQRSLVRDNSVVEVAVADANRKVLASASGARGDTLPSNVRSWTEWQSQNLLGRLNDLFDSSRDIVLESPIGINGSTDPVMILRVSLSPVLLRQTVEPMLYNLAAVSLGSLGLSALLAVIVSKLVGDSLGRLGQKIDLIARGDLKSVQLDKFESPELVDLESKLWWLGRQFSGARTDILHLRSNVEQVLRKLDEAILVFGPDGRLQMAGEAAQRLLAKPKDQLLGRSVSDLFPSWTALGGVIEAAVAARKSLRDHSVLLERPNMPDVRLIINVEPIEYDELSATGVLVTMRDAETRKQLQADLDTAHRLSAISRITSGVAHEIKNPLNAMMLHLEIARDKHQAGSNITPELDVVKSELLRLDRVVKALLDFNRPFDVEMKDCDLVCIASEIVALIRPQADARGIRIAVEHAVSQAAIVADPDLLKQGILNVAINGLEATPDGGHMTIRVQRGNLEHIVAIQDDGPGIPAEIRDKIFNLYFTTKKSGTGVGLAMTYRIMQLHSGSITVDSEVGKGACFNLRLPDREPRKAAA